MLYDTAVSHRCSRIIGSVVLFRMVVSVHSILPSVHSAQEVDYSLPLWSALFFLALPSTLSPDSTAPAPKNNKHVR